MFNFIGKVVVVYGVFSLARVVVEAVLTKTNPEGAKYMFDAQLTRMNREIGDLLDRMEYYGFELEDIEDDEDLIVDTDGPSIKDV